MLTERPGGAAADDADEIYSPPPTHPVLVLASVLALTLATVVATVWLVGEATSSDGVGQVDRAVVPDVIGSDEGAARADLEGRDFVVESSPVRNVDVPVGQVFAQEPPGGVLTEPGATVRLSVSAGDGFALVPQVTGSLVEGVEAQLLAYGLVVGESTSRQDLISLAGEILEQTPAPGEQVPAGSRVDIVVSEGPPPVDVPDIVGFTEVEGRRALMDAGFQVTPVRLYSAARVGTVVSTSPRHGTEAPHGSEVRMFVSRGHAPATTPPPTAPTTPDPATPTTGPPAPTPTTLPAPTTP